MAENTFKEEVTNRGFGYVGFKDRYEQDCSIQVSSLVDPSLWLGVNSQDGGSRMHLSRKQVKKLRKYMKRWLKTGLLIKPPSDTPEADNK